MAKAKKMSAKMAAAQYARDYSDAAQGRPTYQWARTDFHFGFLAGVAWARRQAKKK